MHSNGKKQPLFAVDGPMGGFSSQAKADKTISTYASLSSVLLIVKLMLTALLTDNAITAAIAFIIIIVGIAAYYKNRVGLWLLCLAAIILSGSNLLLKVSLGATSFTGIIVDSVILYAAFRLYKGLTYKG